MLNTIQWIAFVSLKSIKMLIYFCNILDFAKKRSSLFSCKLSICNLFIFFYRSILQWISILKLETFFKLTAMFLQWPVTFSLITTVVSAGMWCWAHLHYCLNFESKVENNCSTLQAATLIRYTVTLNDCFTSLLVTLLSNS